MLYQDVLNLDKTVDDPAKIKMSMATLRKVYGSFDRDVSGQSTSAVNLRPQSTSAIEAGMT